MMAALRNYLWPPKVRPVTHEDVEPAPRDPEREREIKVAQTELVQELMRVERRSWEIRRELAGSVIEIVSGQRQ